MSMHMLRLGIGAYDLLPPIKPEPEFDPGELDCIDSDGADHDATVEHFLRGPISLQTLWPFCVEPDHYRAWLHNPFAIGQRVFASNGHVMVSLPATTPGCEGVAQLQGSNVEKITRLMADARFDEGAFVAFPDIPGDSRVEMLIGCAAVSPWYARMFSLLPGARVRHPATESEALAIKFNGGGMGLLMPRHRGA